MKQVEVETIDPRLFKAIMGLVTKSSNGEYVIFTNDLLYFLEIEKEKANKSISLDYQSLNATQVPHWEMEPVDKSQTYTYIESKKNRIVEEDDKYFITSASCTSVAYTLLNLKKDKEVNFKLEDKMIVDINSTITDCFKYAPQFDA